MALLRYSPLLTTKDSSADTRVYMRGDAWNYCALLVTYERNY
jgi:hypothetical protein